MASADAIRVEPPRALLPAMAGAALYAPAVRHAAFPTDPETQRRQTIAYQLAVALRQEPLLVKPLQAQQTMAAVLHGTIPLDAAVDVLVSGIDAHCGLCIPGPWTHVEIHPATRLLEPLPDGLAGDATALDELREHMRGLSHPGLAWQVVEIRCSPFDYLKAHKVGLRFFLEHIQGILGERFRLSYQSQQNDQLVLRIPTPRLLRAMVRVCLDRPAFDWEFAPGTTDVDTLIHAHERNAQVMGVPLRDIYLGDTNQSVHPAIFRIHDAYHGFQFWQLSSLAIASATELLRAARALPTFQRFDPAIQHQIVSALVEPESYSGRRATLAELVQQATSILRSPVRLSVDAPLHLEFVTALRAACGPAIRLPQARSIIERELDESIGQMRRVMSARPLDEIRRKLPEQRGVVV